MLEAKLGYPHDDPNDAPYYGYHADYLTITRNGGLEIGDVCFGEEGYYNDSGWCKYRNTEGKGSDIAYIGNVDADFDDVWTKIADVVAIQIFTLNVAHSNTMEFTVSHWYWEEDYYTNYETWSDHMMAAMLTIDNLATGEALHPGDGWSHPVDKNVTTHTPDSESNPDYQGKFSVSVTCDELCSCSAHDYTVL
jgi:hypothetical protein